MSNAGNAWYALFLKRGMAEGELITLGIVARLINRLASMALPLLRLILAFKVPGNASINHHLFLEGEFVELPR